MKQQYVKAATNHLHSIQKEKRSLIRYDSLELKDYLNSWSNLKIEEQRFIFSVRSDMNPLNSNFKRSSNIKAEFCIEKCGKELNNDLLVWCHTHK